MQTPQETPIASAANGWLDRYAHLARMMYQVRRACPRLCVLGISILHPRHAPPPDHLELLARLAQGGSPRMPSWVTIMRAWCWTVLFALRDSLLLWVLKIRFAPALRRALADPAAVLIKTWRFGPKAVSEGGDFYYGTLPEELRARGLRCLVLCGDARWRIDAAFMDAAFRRDSVRTVPEQLLIPSWAPLVTVFRQLATAFALRRLTRQAGDSRLAQVYAAACLQSVNPFTMRNTLYFHLAREAVRRLRPRAFLTLYEGQPWELPAWQGAKAADPACRIVGYQHTVVMPHSLSVLAPHDGSWERSAPDVVLCLGEVTRAMMAEGHQRRGTRLVPFGTFRPFPVSESLRTPSPGKRVVLVVPETGIIREAVLLFEFAMQAARTLPDHRFIFRCHPIMPFDRLRAYLREAPEAFPNIEVSRTRSFEEDCERASVVLYRGSSSVLYAVMHGLKPLYLHEARHEHSDPLFELEGWRERVDSMEEFANAARRYAAASEPDAVSHWEPAAAYVRTYAMPVTERSLDLFLDAVGLSDEGSRG